MTGKGYRPTSCWSGTSWSTPHPPPKKIQAIAVVLDYPPELEDTHQNLKTPRMLVIGHEPYQQQEHCLEHSKCSVNAD